MSNPFAALDSDDEDRQQPVIKAPKKTAAAPMKNGVKKTKTQARNPGRSAGRSRGGRSGGRTAGGRSNSRRPAGNGRDRDRQQRKEGSDKHLERRERNRQDSRSRTSTRRFDRRPRNGYGKGDKVKKGGAGGHNWGSPTENLEETAPASASAVVKEGETKGEEVKDGEVVEETEAKEPEKKQMTLDEYLATGKSRRTGDAFAAREERTVDDKSFAGMKKQKAIKLGGNVYEIGGTSKKGVHHGGQEKGHNKGFRHGAKLVEDGSLIGIRSGAPERDGRDRRGGRGGRSERQNGKRATTTSAPDAKNYNNDFPALC